MIPARRAPRVPPRVRGAVASFHQDLAARFGERLLDVRLFGSYARGDFGPDSDADVLIVIEGLTHAEKMETFSLAADRFLDHFVRVSPLALSSDEHGLLRRQDRLILREIARDGVAL